MNRLVISIAASGLLLGSCKNKEEQQTQAKAEPASQTEPTAPQQPEPTETVNPEEHLVDCDALVTAEDFSPCGPITYEPPAIAFPGEEPDHIGPDTTCSRVLKSKSGPARADFMVMHLLEKDVKPFSPADPGSTKGAIAEQGTLEGIGDEARWYTFGGGLMNNGLVLDYRKKGVSLHLVIRGLDESLDVNALCPTEKLNDVLTAIDARVPDLTPRPASD